MKQITVCLDRYFEERKPLHTKWQAREHPEIKGLLCLFHYHHLVLIYDTEHNKVIYEWWEKQADKRGLDAAKEYLNTRIK